jgi:hypothetical protein
VIRLGSCKRSAAELVRDLPVFHGHVQRFLGQFPSYAGWRVERISLAPQVPQDVRQEIERQGSLVQDLKELTRGFEMEALDGGTVGGPGSVFGTTDWAGE